MKEEYEILQETLERRIRRGEDTKKSISCWHENHTYHPWKIIKRYLRVYANKPYDEFYQKVINKLKPEDYHKIDDYVFRENANGDIVDSYGRPFNITKYTIKTTARTSYLQYYIEKGILKCHKPYCKFPKEKQRKQISKKIIPVEKHYAFKFNYDLVWDELPPEYPYQNDFIKWCEENKKTYRIREYGVVPDGGKWIYDKTTKRFKILSQRDYTITHIKTNYQ